MLSLDEELTFGKPVSADRLAVLKLVMTFVSHLSQLTKHGNAPRTRNTRGPNIFEDSSLTPFFICLCNVVATLSADNFHTLKQVTDELESLTELSTSIAKLQTLLIPFIDL